MTLAPGSRVGSYEVGELIGAGGMGEVYRARDTKLNRSVALKILPEIFLADSDRLVRFHREAQLLASLNHPNIGHIYGLEDSAGAAALVLELVEGPTLADRIAQAPLPIDEALAVARQIADALEAAHEQGVVHRDLKPANIKIGVDGTVKVLDFGLAKALEPPGAATVDAMNSPTLTAMGTKLGVIIGTAAYMAPEQARGKPVDRRADIWAFGVVLYEMLTGRRPFEGETVTDTIAAIVQQEPDWSRLPPATPAAVHRVLRRCLEKDVKRRLRDIADARVEIVEGLEQKPAAGSRPPVSAPPPRWPLWWAALSTVALAAVAAVAWWFPRAAEPRIVTRLDIATPPTTEGGSFAMSADGRQVVFAADDDKGVSQLWLRSLDQRSGHPLAGTEDGSQPFWAPDGHAIGFFASGRLKTLDFATGLVRTLASAPVPRGGTWNRDGVVVFSPNTTVSLQRISANGGQASALTTLPPTQGSHRWPQFLPDGKHVLFSTGIGDPSNQGLYIASLDGGDPTRVLSGADLGDAAPVYAAPGALLIVRRGVLLARPYDPDRRASPGEPVPIVDSASFDRAIFRPAISASANGVLAHRANGVERRQLVWMDRSGKELDRVGPADDAGLASPALSPDGQRVAVTRAVEGSVDIWVLDVRRGTFSRVASGVTQALLPLWSPDGRELAFRASSAGSFDIDVTSMTGGGAIRTLVADRQSKRPVAWSPDGRTLLFVSIDPRTGADLWAVPSSGGAKPFPVVRANFDQSDASFSPDGRWIVYQSNESGREEIYVRPFAEDGRSQTVQLISTGGGSQARWSPIGKEIFYLSPGGQMMAVPIEIGHDGVSVSSGAPVPLFSVHVASGAYISTIGAGTRAQYDIARDGRFLINTAAQDYVPPPISIVLNWDALLPKRR